MLGVWLPRGVRLTCAGVGDLFFCERPHIVQIGPHILQNRTPYLAKRDMGEGLPLVGVVAANAAACGFSREAFYDNPRLAALLAEYLERLAADGSESMS